MLVIHLKRFSYGGQSGKISKGINFDFDLNVPCSSSSSSDSGIGSGSGTGSGSGSGISSGSGSKVSYGLIGVVVHHGSSIHSGHYVAFVKVNLINLSSIKRIVFKIGNEN